jgi:hypothetical protein
MVALHTCSLALPLLPLATLSEGLILSIKAGWDVPVVVFRGNSSRVQIVSLISPGLQVIIPHLANTTNVQDHCPHPTIPTSGKHIMAFLLIILIELRLFNLTQHLLECFHMETLFLARVSQGEPVLCRTSI